MAATGSERPGRDRRGGARPRRLSLRLRLTLLYGACFLIGSGAVLAVTYVLVARETSSQTRQLHIGGTGLSVLGGPVAVQMHAFGAPVGRGELVMIEQASPSPSGRVITWVPVARSGMASGTPVSAATLRSRRHAQEDRRYESCMRGDGVPDYPNTGAQQDAGNVTLKGTHVFVDGRKLAEPRSVVARANDRCGQYIDPAFGPRYTTAQLAEVQVGALAMSRCMRARGIDYPNLKVNRGPGGYGVGVSFPGGLSHARVDARSAAFKSANSVCSKLLNRTMPAARGRSSGSTRLVASAEHTIKVVLDRANGALSTQQSRSLRVLLMWSAIALAVMALVSILLGWLVAGRALRPLHTMTTRARRITEESLHQRLSEDTREDELGELASTFDGVLARLERAFKAHRRFVANASHELRTPITLERALLEIALASPDADAETLRRACERVLASTKQQQQMIEALLTLARSQGGSDVDAPADLAELAEDAIALREHRLDGITLAADLHHAPLTGDPALLERLLANLIDNAIVHNRDEDAWISVETGHEGSSSWLRVSNSGPEVPEWMISEIFEPFRRVEGERTATATGVGLGLSIVQAIADVHDAVIDAGPLRGGGLRVEVRF